MATRIYNNKVYQDQYMSSSAQGKWFANWCSCDTKGNGCH